MRSELRQWLNLWWSIVKVSSSVLYSICAAPAVMSCMLRVPWLTWGEHGAESLAILFYSIALCVAYAWLLVIVAAVSSLLAKLTIELVELCFNYATNRNL